MLCCVCCHFLLTDNSRGKLNPFFFFFFLFCFCLSSLLGYNNILFSHQLNVWYLKNQVLFSELEILYWSQRGNSVLNCFWKESGMGRSLSAGCKQALSFYHTYFKEKLKAIFKIVTQTFCFKHWLPFAIWLAVLQILYEIDILGALTCSEISAEVVAIRGRVVYYLRHHPTACVSARLNSVVMLSLPVDHCS